MRLIPLIIGIAILGQLGMAYQLPTTIKKGAVMNFKKILTYPTQTEDNGQYVTENFYSQGRGINVIPISEKWIAIQHLDEDFFRSQVISENANILNAEIVATTLRLDYGGSDYVLDRLFASLMNNKKGYYYPIFKDYYTSSNYHTIKIGQTISNKYRSCFMSVGINYPDYLWAYHETTLNAQELGYSSITNVMTTYVEVDTMNFGSIITVTSSEGAVITINTGIDATPAIKVNQLGYATTSNVKWAYIGWGLPMLDQTKTDYISNWTIMTFNIIPDVTTFDVCHVSDNSIEYTGIISNNTSIPMWKWNSPNALSDTNAAYSANELGENVLKIDFSAITKKGNYYIKCPALGRSYSFYITDNFLVNAIYHSARRIINQRYTTWNTDSNYYTTSKNILTQNGLRWGVAPESAHCRNYRSATNTTNYGLWEIDISGNEVTVSYGASGESCYVQNEKCQNQTSINYILDNGISINNLIGYFDAADMDSYSDARSPYSGHRSMFQMLSKCFLSNPTLWTDNQLGIINYKNNGIPDLLDEWYTYLKTLETLRQITSSNYRGLVGHDFMDKDKNLYPGEKKWYHIPTRESSARIASSWAELAYCLKIITTNHYMITESISIATDIFNIIQSGVTLTIRTTMDTLTPSPNNKLRYLEWREWPLDMVFPTWSENLYRYYERPQTVYLAHCLNLLIPSANLQTYISNNYLSFSQSYKKESAVYIPLIQISPNTLVSVKNYIYNTGWTESALYKPYGEDKDKYSSLMSYMRDEWDTSFSARAIYLMDMYLVSKNVYWKERAREICNFLLGCNPRSESKILGVTQTGFNWAFIPKFINNLYDETQPGTIMYESGSYFRGHANANTQSHFLGYKSLYNTPFFDARYMSSANAVSMSMMSNDIDVENVKRYGYSSYLDKYGSGKMVANWPSRRKFNMQNGLPQLYEYTVWSSFASLLMLLTLAADETPHYSTSTQLNWRPSSAVWRDYPRRIFLLP